MAHPKDVAGEVFRGLGGKRGQAPVVLIVVAMYEVVDESAEVRFRLPHRGWRRAEGVRRNARLVVHFLPEREG